MDPRKLAIVYDREVVPGWQERFVPFLMEALPYPLPPKSTLLEIGCATGRLTQELAGRLPVTGRLIAIEEKRELMDIARGKIVEANRKQVFFKQESPERVSFAGATFDGVLSAGLVTRYDFQKVIRESARLLKDNGFLLLGIPLRGCFQELLDIFREVLEKEDLIPTLAALDTLSAMLPDRPTAGRMLSEAGLVESRVRVREETLAFANGLAFLQSPLVREYCLDDCLSLIRDRSWREGVLAGMIRGLDTYFPSGIELTLVLGRLEGTKP